MHKAGALAALMLLAACARGHNPCADPPMTLCDVPMMPPVIHKVGTLAKGSALPPHRPGEVVRQVGTPDKSGGALYLVSEGQGLRGALVGGIPQRDGSIRWVTYVADADLARYDVVARPDELLGFFALADRATGIGTTYMFDWRAGRAVVYAPDSKLVRGLWWSSRNSSCGGGPLTRIPPEVERRWQAEYDAWAAKLRAECEAKRPLWQRIAGGA